MDYIPGQPCQHGLLHHPPSPGHDDPRNPARQEQASQRGHPGHSVVNPDTQHHHSGESNQGQGKAHPSRRHQEQERHHQVHLLQLDPRPHRHPGVTTAQYLHGDNHLRQVLTQFIKIFNTSVDGNVFIHLYDKYKTTFTHNSATRDTAADCQLRKLDVTPRAPGQASLLATEDICQEPIIREHFYH